MKKDEKWRNEKKYKEENKTLDLQSKIILNLGLLLIFDIIIYIK